MQTGILFGWQADAPAIPATSKSKPFLLSENKKITCCRRFKTFLKPGLNLWPVYNHKWIKEIDGN
jgi:hypothetical protein